MVKYQEPLELMGVPGSPYTRKMLALLRYRRIRHHLLPGSRHRVATDGDGDRYRARPMPKVPLLPTFYGRDENGEEVAVCDSTPLIREFESLSADRSVIPAAPAFGLINSILEDYGDEWLTKAMFHYRWTYEPDIKKAGQMLPRWNNITASDELMAERSQEISDLQISRLRYVGSNPVTRTTIEDSFQRFLGLLDNHLNSFAFLLGKRPASCDFAVYGQLTCLALFDPTSQQLVLEHAPRVHAWTEVMEDLSGFELMDNDWIINSEADTELPPSLSAILKEVGAVYVPYLLANAKAAKNQQQQFKTTIADEDWEQQTFSHQYKCLQWLLNERAELSNGQGAHFDLLIGNTEISHLFKQIPGLS
ncbi:MAG: glutathione S-transferase [Pseudomonadales bacterium]|nr:glutathione S-transferase [Pseudomonadales bacterium]